MKKRPTYLLLLLGLLIATTACSNFTDAATRLAYDIESGANQLGVKPGDRYRIRHVTPSQLGQCTGPYTAQFDKVGAIIIWCKDVAGATVSSHSTTYHARFADTAETFLVEKAAGAALIVDLERRSGRAVIVAVE